MASTEIKREYIPGDKNDGNMDTDDAMVLGSIKCQLKYVKRADGSCAYSHNGNFLVCSVNGPGDVKQEYRNEEKMFVDLTISSASNKDKAIQAQLQHVILPLVRGALILENHPRARLAITCLEVENSIIRYSDCINAICLALMDNGIDMKYQFCSVVIIQEKNTRKFILDPTNEQLREAESTFQLVYKPSLIKGADLIGVECFGNFLFQEFEDACRIGVKAAFTFFDFYRKIINKATIQ
uniref:RNase_PH domain-containing protein n=1 Tax=Parastrongyloides trichosuri TaxID=131310 RepID=A0A0N4ZGH3_PARTI